MDKFNVTKTAIGDFCLYRLYAANAGAVNFTADPVEESRVTPTRISMVTSGARSYGALDEEPVVQAVGAFNIELQNKMPGITYKITAMEPNTEYHCVSRADLKPYNYERVVASAGSQIVLPACRYMFIGGGRVDGVDAPRLISMIPTDRTLDVETNAFGLIFWG